MDKRIKEKKRRRKKTITCHFSRWIVAIKLTSDLSISFLFSAPFTKPITSPVFISKFYSEALTMTAVATTSGATKRVRGEVQAPPLSWGHSRFGLLILPHFTPSFPFHSLLLLRLVGCSPWGPRVRHD